MSFINIPVITSMIGQIPSSSGSCTPVTSSELVIGGGTSTSSSVWAYGLYDYSWYSAIWLNTELTGGTKQITGIEVEMQGYTTPYTYNNMTVKLGHVVESIFDTTPAVDWSDMTVSNVITATTFNMTINASGFQVITFNTNFCYDGTSNLIIGVDNNDGTWESGFGSGKYNFTPAINRAAYKAQDTTFPTGNGTRNNSRINIKFKY